MQCNQTQPPRVKQASNSNIIISSKLLLIFFRLDWATAGAKSGYNNRMTPDDRRASKEDVEDVEVATGQARSSLSSEH